MKNKLINIFKSLKNIFRISFIWNLIFPFLLGLILNAELIDSRQLIIYVVWIPICCLPFLLFRKKFLIFIPWLASFIIGFLDVIHWVTIKTPVSKYSLFVMFESNLNEAASFVNLKWSFLILIVPFYIIVSIYLLVKDFKKEIFISKVPILAVFLFSLIFMTENYMNNRFIRKSTPTVVVVIESFYKEIVAYREITKNIESYIGNINATSLDLEKEQITVLILGESTARNKMSLYGFKKETNPLLSKRDDLYIYTDVISPFTHTQSSVRTCLTYSNIQNDIKYTQAQSIIDLARASEYETYWISNQASIGIWDNLVAALSKTTQHVMFVNDVLNSQKLLLTSTYDEKVLAPFGKVLKDKHQKKFIVIHLLGTHASYHKRYPEEFNVFKSAENDKDPEIATYYNAVLYNDFVVNSIIDTLSKYAEKNNSLANLIFFSDHGENLYEDERGLSGHDWWGMPTKHLLEIPFIVWTSGQYKNRFPAIDSIIVANKDKAFSTDNFFHSALDLMHIENTLFVDSLSIFNSSYIEKERFVEKEKISYENEVLKGKLLENKTKN
ncbi:MAG: heptose-I-phosphate ethanolaminephosphotransferase [Planctomycetota bacterium]|jgi:heptose-I-phosphate ethanolaminephosphotransferase